MSNVIIFHWNNVLTDVEPELIKRGHKVKSYSRYPMSEKDFKAVIKAYPWADVVLFWNEIDKFGWKEQVEAAKKAKCKTILYQHGRRGTSRIFPPFNEKLISDIILAWGEGDKKRLMSTGLKEDRIKVVGTSIFDCLRPREKHEGKNVVFCVEHWCEDVSENYIIASQLRKTGLNIITKCLKTETITSLFDNPVVSDRSEPDHLPIVANTLSKADVVVGISESTFELLAQYLDIPVVIADIWQPKACAGDERYKEYKRIYSDACLKEKDVFKLGNTIKWHLKHPEYLREERKQICIEDGGTNIKNPTEEIIKTICQS